MLGGGAAFTVNAGKALARAKVSAWFPAHGGLGNAAVSLGEDLVATLGVILVPLAPWLAGLLALFLVLGSAWLVMVFIRKGGRVLAWLSARARCHQILS